MSQKQKFILLGSFILGGLIIVAFYLHRTSIPVLEPRGVIAQQERQLIIIASALSLVVVIPVFTLLFWIAWRYRESNKQATYQPDWDHHPVIETIWWLIPTILIGIISVITWNSSHSLDPYRPLNSPNKPLTIQVVALDWKWLFIYPEQNIASVNFVQFPEQTPVTFQITADAPMNSFWIPQLGGQIYAMPGMSTELHLMASQNGSFHGSSANISGSGFAGMAFVARASSPTAFDRWVQTARHSPNRLSLAAYQRLSEPSQNNPVSYYASAEGGLYYEIVTKFMEPLQDLNNGGQTTALNETGATE